MTQKDDDRIEVCVQLTPLNDKWPMCSRCGRPIEDMYVNEETLETFEDLCLNCQDMNGG